MLAIERALMARPRPMLLDDPYLGLASPLVKEIFEIVEKICNEEKTTVLLVEQNVNLALSICQDMSWRRAR
jgi:branched-chain amino acid transport system ATP-binding protein